MKKRNDLEKAKILVTWVTCFFAVGVFDGIFTLGIPDWVYFFLGIGVIVSQIWLLRIIFRLNK